MADKPKREPTNRIYPITAAVGGKVRYIEAPNPCAAAVFALKPQIGEPLNPQEILALIRAQGIAAIEIIPKAETKEA